MVMCVHASEKCNKTVTIQPLSHAAVEFAQKIVFIIVFVAPHYISKLTHFTNSTVTLPYKTSTVGEL